mgnify:CR=1 FL=1
MKRSTNYQFNYAARYHFRVFLLNSLNNFENIVIDTRICIKLTQPFLVQLYVHPHNLLFSFSPSLFIIAVTKELENRGFKFSSFLLKP